MLCRTRLAVLSVRCRTEAQRDQLIERSGNDPRAAELTAARGGARVGTTKELTAAFTLSCQRRLDGKPGLSVELTRGQGRGPQRKSRNKSQSYCDIVAKKMRYRADRTIVR